MSFALILITAVVVVVAIALGVSHAHDSANSPSSTSHAGKTSNPTLLQLVTHIDPAVYVAVGTGGQGDQLTALPKASPLVDASSKPIVFFVGSETCGACAAQRWSIVVALSRFGTFSHLPLLIAAAGTATSAVTTTFTFYGSAYTSTYLDFVGVEQTDSAGKTLQTLTADGQRLLSTYDAPPYVAASLSGNIPWLDIGNRYVTQGSRFLLQGQAWGQIANGLSTPSAPVTQAIIGSANYLTAAICKATSMKPASVCQAAPISGMVAQLP